MKIESHPPTGRTGVSQLMYVGDDGLPDVGPDIGPTGFMALVALVGLGYLAGTSKGVLRLGAVAGAAVLVYKSNPGAFSA